MTALMTAGSAAAATISIDSGQYVGEDATAVGAVGGAGYTSDGNVLIISGGTFTGGMGGPGGSGGGFGPPEFAGRGGDGLVAIDTDLTISGGAFTGGPSGTPAFIGDGRAIVLINSDAVVTGGIIQGGTLPSGGATDEFFVDRNSSLTLKGDFEAFTRSTSGDQRITVTGTLAGNSAAQEYQIFLASSSEFQILPVPEPHALAVLLVGAPMLLGRIRA